MAHSQSQTYNLAFLQDWAADRLRPLAEQEKAILQTTHDTLLQADEVIIYLGGKAGRLGECVVGTALLEASLHALSYAGKAGVPVHIIVDEAAIELFHAKPYQEKYWPTITTASSTRAARLTECIAQQGKHKTLLVLDFHGAHDGLPYLELETITAAEGDNQVATLAHLFRVGLRSYARRGQDRRYADFVENLFALPAGSIEGQYAQPNILLSDDDSLRYELLVEKFALNPSALQVICFFQSVVPAKCYERWDEVMLLLCEYFALHFPRQPLDFLLACGPDEHLPAGFKKADIEEWLQDFTGVNQNARVLVHTTASLYELGVLTSKATLVLSNDTGPGHIAGALKVPTITPFLPGNLYSKHIWSSTLWHRGVTLEPNPFSYQQLEAAVIWGKTDIINSIPPAVLHDEIVKCLPAEFHIQSLNRSPINLHQLISN